MATAADRSTLQTLHRARKRRVDAGAVEADLRERVRGEVRFDEACRAVYSCDSSNYRQAPFGVVCPRDADDVVSALRVLSAHRTPLTFRGAGTSLAGQATNATVIVDTSRHMRSVLEVDPDARLARVQPGVTRDQLAKPLEARHQLSFPPDTSTHAYATFGGMIANNSCGAHSVMTGRTSDNLAEMEIALADGTSLRVGPTTEDELEAICAGDGRRAKIYRALRDLRDRYGDLVRERYPKIPRRVSGFNLDELLPENGFHVARALSGTEGTCAAILEATVHLHPWPRAKALLILGYPSIFEAADDVPDVMATGPMACEAIDQVLVDDMQRQGLHSREIPMLPEGARVADRRVRRRDQGGGRREGACSRQAAARAGGAHVRRPRRRGSPVEGPRGRAGRDGLPARRHGPLRGLGGRRRGPRASRRLPARLPGAPGPPWLQHAPSTGTSARASCTAASTSACAARAASRTTARSWTTSRRSSPRTVASSPASTATASPRRCSWTSSTARSWCRPSGSSRRSGTPRAC